MRVAFFCEASPEVGMGHLLRCLALAQALDADRHRAVFVLNAQSAKIARERLDWVGDILELKDPFSTKTLELIKKQLDFEKFSWVVVDSYTVLPEFFIALSDVTFKIATLDDFVLKDFSNVNMVVNPAASASQMPKQYASSKQTIKLLGPQFRLLRKEFREFDYVSAPYKKRRLVTICMGGSDTHDLTLSILKGISDWLSNQRQKTFGLQVVTGPSYSKCNLLLDFINASSINIKHVHNAQNMADIWSSSALAISAAGGSQFELNVCGTPSILIVVAQNQLAASLKAAEKGWCKVLVHKDSTDKLMKETIVLLQNLISNESLRLSMHEKAVKTAYKNGALLIVESMLESAS